MRVTTLFLTVTCLVLPFTDAISIPDIRYLKGPATNSTVSVIEDGSPTNPSSTTFGTGTSSRLSLYVPGTVYSDYPGWLALYNALVMQGIPVKVTKSITEAITHPTVIVYQGLQSQYMGSTDGATWASYVNGGNTLIAIGLTSTDLNITATFGVTADTVTNAKNRTALLINEPSDAFPISSINNQFDLTDDRDAQIPLWESYVGTGFPTIGYIPENNQTFALGFYINVDGAIETKYGITVKSTSNGGQAVAIGLDVGTLVGISNGINNYGIPRSYDAQYEPGYDNFFRIFKSLYVQSTSTGLVTSWPVPGNKGVHFSWTYDIDAQDSYELALVAAKDLQSRGIKGTINWQAKLVKDAYDISSFSQYYRNISLVEALGNMELSSHSVSHSPNLMEFPVGTGTEIWDGTVYNEENYFPFIGQCVNGTGTDGWTTDIPDATSCDTPNKSLYFYTISGSLYGEARVSKYILESISIVNATIKSYRTGHLLYPNALPQVLASVGYKYSSSSANNDQNTNMPFQPFNNMGYNQVSGIMEFPVSGSDEDGDINGDFYPPGSGNYPNGSYAYQQYQVIQKIAKYGGQYTFLTHPTTHAIPGVAPSLFSDKLAFQQILIPLISNVSYFDSIEGRGDFHTARIASGIDVSVSGTTATVTITLPLSIIDLTIRVPTAWAFVSSTTAVNVTSGAVILVGSVPAGTVTILFKTSGTVATTSAPVPSAPTSTTTVSMTTPTPPAPTLASINPLIVDDFSDPSRYSNGSNALGFYTDDDHTMTQRTTVQDDWLLLSFAPSSYWYTLLGEANTCNDYSNYTSLNFALRYPNTTRVGFNAVIQDVDNTTCSTMTQRSFSLTSLINAATPGNDGWLHIEVPLSNYNGTNFKSLKAISLDGFPSTSQVEIDYIYFS